MTSKDFLKAMKWIFIVAAICFATVLGLIMQFGPLIHLQNNQKFLEQQIYALVKENKEQTEQIAHLERVVQQDIYLNGKWED